MSCPHCDDTGWRPVDGDGVRRVERCDCWRAGLADKLLHDARIPPRHERCDLDGFQDYNDSLVEAVRRARRFIEKYPVVDRGLIFVGSPGVGKTHVAVAVLRQVVRQSAARGLFWGTRELLRVIRDTYNPVVKTTEIQVIRPVIDAEILVLDDLGAERLTDWVEETMNLIVNTRYNERRPTIFTSNYPLQAPPKSHAETLHERVGFRVYSRLHEMCDFVELEGVDYRELGPNASNEQLVALQRKGSASHRAPVGRGRPMAKAKLHEGQLDLGWSGGKAGS